ncbi:MAG: sugar transferase [bacterium]
MIKEREDFIRNLTILFDSILIYCAFFTAYLLKKKLDLSYPLNIHTLSLKVSFDRYLWLLLIIHPLWIGLFYFHGLYKPFRIKGYLEIFWIILKSNFFGTLLFGSIVFILRLTYVSRLFIFIFSIINLLFFGMEKFTLRKLLHYIRKKGYNYRNVLLVGTGNRAEQFISILKEHAEWGLKIEGIIDIDYSMQGRKIADFEVIGTLDDISDILCTRVIDEVVFVIPRLWLNKIESIIKYCELQGIKVSIAVDLFNLKIAKCKSTDLHGFPLVSFETTNYEEWELFIKRCFDVAISLFGLIILFPLLTIVAILIKLTSPGPIFFKQVRSTLKGRKFFIYKFRSMYINAEEGLKDLVSMNEMSGPVFKIKNDPRATFLGRILRKTSMDELPQLINVLIGDMSIVGPRPPIPEEVEKYEPWHRRRLSIKPGITCLWQVMGRNKIGFEKWMELDMQYIDNWSLWLDFKILLKTIQVVLFGFGAM